VASVQGEPITLDEFNQQLAAMKQAQTPEAKADRSAELALLRRLIHLALIVQEARRMELDKLPEARKMVDSFARVTLREELVERVTRGVKADPKEVEEIYQAAVREWKISAALFEKGEHARSMETELGRGQSFGELAKAYLADGRATKVEDGVLLRRPAMDPAIRNVVAGMAVGSTSSVISTKSGHVIVRLEEIRFADDPAAKAKAEQIVLTNKRKEAVTTFDQALKKKYVRIDRAVLASVDFESDKPGIEALLKDRRVLAETRGEKPITVES
jgi:parvulin-like peptidyl-prolyl isomerase